MIIKGLHEKNIYMENFPFRLVENTQDSFEYPPHWHNAVEILYVRKNSFPVKINNKDMLLKERDILFIAGGDIHSFPKNEYGGSRIFIQFDPANLQGIGTGFLNPFLADTAAISPDSSPEFHKSLEEQIKMLMDEYLKQKRAYEFALNARIFDIMAILSRNCPDDKTPSKETKTRKNFYGREKLNKAFEYIENNYRNEISLKEVAGFSGFSQCHFSRIFKETMEKNFHDYLKEYKIKKSEKLLSDFRYSIAQTAYMSGFNSLATFNRAFREVKGCTPTAYRKLYLVQ